MKIYLHRPIKIPQFLAPGEPVQEKASKVPKLNQKQQKPVDLEVKAMLQKGSILKFCHAKGEFLIFEWLVSYEQKKVEETTQS